MDSLEQGEKGRYRVADGYGIISFDFAREDTLHVSRFFQELARCLKESSFSNISFLIIELTGFRDREAIKKVSAHDVRNSFQFAEESFRMFSHIRIPILGAVRGFLCGPLLEALLFIDFPIVARSTRLSSLMIESGYMPQMGMLTNLSDRIGRQELFRFIVDGIDFTSGAPVLDTIAYRIVDDDSIDREIISLCKRIAGMNRYPVRLIKELSISMRNLSSAQSDILERYSFALCFSEGDFKEKIDQFFKRKT